jgi:hypothetical protein
LGQGLLAPNPLLVLAELTRRVHDRDVLQRRLNLRLGLRHLGSSDQLIALLDELVASHGHLVEAVLQLVDERGLLLDLRVECLDLVLEADLTA